MQTVSEVMTRGVSVVSPHDSLQHAAGMMDELNVGALPVCDGESLVGMVTDRDIAVRGTAAGKMPAEAQVEEVMSTDVRWCFEDQPLDEVMQQMGYSQIRRLPVISHDDARRLVGIVSLGDVVTKGADDGQHQDMEQLAAKVSSPSGPPGGRGPQIGTDSGSASVPSGGAGGTGTTGLAGIGTAGGTGSTGTAGNTDGRSASEGDAAGGANDVGTAGDYSR
jgi:CBS domain-containing protein